MLAVLVSIQLRAGGPRHASGTRQLPSKPCRPLNCYFTTFANPVPFATLRPAYPPSPGNSNLTQLLQNPTYGVACLVRDAEYPVAYLVICFDYSLEYRGKGAWIDELFVKASHRGQGIGTQLLDLAETISREHHAQFLHLEVSHGNPAVELYRRRGFVDHQRYLMTKPLNP